MKKKEIWLIWLENMSFIEKVRMMIDELAAY